MPTGFHFPKKFALLLALPVLLQLGCLVSLYATLNRLEFECSKVARSEDIEKRGQQLEVRLADMASDLRTQLYIRPELVDPGEAADRYFDQMKLVGEARAEQTILLRMLNSDRDFTGRDEQSKSVMEKVNRALMNLRETARALKTGERSDALDNMRDFDLILAQIHLEMPELTTRFGLSHAQTLLLRQTADVRTALQLVGAAFVFGIGSVVLIMKSSRERNAERLKILTANAERFARRESLLPAPKGEDELSELDRVFRQMAATIISADRQKEDYLAMIAHDLRTPLSSIAGSLTMLAEEGLGEPIPPRSLEVICRTQANASRLINLINDLLNLETIQAGKIQLQLENVPVAYVLESVFETMNQLAQQKSVEVKIPMTDLEVYGDGDRLVQVMTNLLSNAIRYSAAGDSIEISVIQSGADVELRVQDHGPGIPEEKVTTIFDKFEQAQKVTLNSWGLGLAICKEIVTLHNGTIGVQSKLGEGSTFWFRVPLARNGISESSVRVSKIEPKVMS